MTFHEEIRGRRAQPMSKLQEALLVLARHEVDFVVVGGVAAVFHGCSAGGADLDLCYSRQPANLERLTAALSPLHPRRRDLPSDVPFSGTLREGTPFQLSTDLGPIDLLTDLPGIGDFQRVKAASVLKELFGSLFPVLSLDALIANKKACGRLKDLNVIPELEALREASGD